MTKDSDQPPATPITKDSDQPLNIPPRDVGTPFQSILNDANSLPSRLDTYKGYSKGSNHTPAKKKIEDFEATLSVVEGLGANVITNNVPEPEVDKLIGSIYNNLEAASKLTNNQNAISKLKLNAAKTEAALKGFVLPLKMEDSLKNFGLKQDEYEIPMEATKQALLEMSNKNIPKAEFSQKVSEKTQEILKDQGHPQDKLNQFKQFVEQGKKENASPNMTDQEKKDLAEAATKSAIKLTEAIDKDIEEIKITKPSLSKQASNALKGAKEQLKSLPTPKAKVAVRAVPVVGVGVIASKGVSSVAKSRSKRQSLKATAASLGAVINKDPVPSGANKTATPKKTKDKSKGSQKGGRG